MKNYLHPENGRLLILNLNLYCLDKVEENRKFTPKVRRNMNLICLLIQWKATKFTPVMELAKKNLLKTIFGFCEIKVENFDQLNEQSIFGLIFSKCVLSAKIPSYVPWMYLHSRLDLPIPRKYTGWC